MTEAKHETTLVYSMRYEYWRAESVCGWHGLYYCFQPWAKSDGEDHVSTTDS